MSRKGWRYLLYDVFTDRPLTGNQLAVFPEPEGLTADDMARITREMNFSESTFLFPAEQADTRRRLRIFGLDGEMPFAGHPVIGSTFALAHEGVVQPAERRVVLGLGIGPTPVDLEWSGGQGLGFAWMTLRPPVFGAPLDLRARLAAAVGLEPEAILKRVPIQEVSCGLSFLYVPLASRAAVDGCQPDARSLDVLLGEAGLPRRAVFLFSVEPGDGQASVYGRMFDGGREDAATGSASGPLGCYLVRHGLVAAEEAARLVSRQGVKMGRPSLVRIRIAGTPAAIREVQVGGASVLVGEGRITRI